MESLPVLGFTIFMSLGALVTLGLFAGSAIYDVKAIRTMKPLSKSPNARRFRRRPLVSVVVLTANSQATISTCLESIAKSSYKKYEVIVVDKASHDDTVSIIKGFAARHAKKAIRIIAKQKTYPRSALIGSAMRQAKGELIVAIDADTELFAGTIKQAVNHFLVDPELAVLTARPILQQDYSVISQVRQLGHALQARLDKTRNVLGRSPRQSQLLVFKREVYKKLQNNTPFYASDVIVKPLSKRRAGVSLRLSAVVWLMWAFVSAFVAYMWYVALTDRVLEPLAVLWLGITAAGLLILATDDHLRAKEKLNVLALLPAWFIFSCVYLIKQILSPLLVLTRIRVRISFVA